MKTITTCSLFAAFLFICHNSYAQLPFTAENMENFSRMNQHDFIAAMKAFPDFKEVENPYLVSDFKECVIYF